MKKIVLLSAIALISFSSFAQGKGSDAAVTYGIKAGLTFPNVALSGIDATTDAITSFYVGAIIDFPITDMLSVQPGVSFIGKGFTSVKKVNPIYIEVPVNLVGKLKAGPGKVFVGLGPYLGVGIAGKAGDSDIKFGDGKTFQTLDFGLNFMLGYQLTNGLSINGGYGLGLTDINGIKVSGTSFKNKLFSVGLGFNF